MAEVEKFRPDYLLLLDGKGEIVSELIKNRYLPLRPAKISEKLVQLIWKNLLFKSSEMKTTKGLSVRILKAGRFNFREGPDFKQSLFVLDGKEMAGDVEIHINQREWYEHKHHVSPHYDNTILHVFLNSSDVQRSTLNRKGKALHDIELNDYLRHPIEQLQKEIEAGESPVSGRLNPTPCYKAFSRNDFGDIDNILKVVGEGRMLIKSNRFIERFDSVTSDQALYESMFECLGYSRFKKQFCTLAETVDRKSLYEEIDKSDEAEDIVIQSIFFNLAGFINNLGDLQGDVELEGLIEKYSTATAMKFEPVFNSSQWSLLGCRPANYPYRRIAAFSQLIGPLSSVGRYEKIFEALPVKYDRAVYRKTIVKMINDFISVSDRFWDLRYTFAKTAKSRKKLIGRDRAISLIVDCLLPFFLSLSRGKHDVDMEKKLLGLYYTLPKPSSNAVIDFTARNLFGKGRSVKSVVQQQALIQLYNDFCYKAPASCNDCPMPDYISDPKLTNFP